MTREQELFESAADAIAEMAGVLASLKRDHPEDAVVERCINVQEQLTWYLGDARGKLDRNEFTEEDATALALIVERGMNKMIRIVEPDEKSLTDIQSCS
jgi:hypothetical protein